MTTPHLINVLIHVLGGAAAIVLGFVILAAAKGTAWHRRRGRQFVALALVVCMSAALGSALFRFVPVFAMLTVLVLYQLLSGWHAVFTRVAGPNALDALMALGAAVGAVLLVPVVLAELARLGQSPAVVYATLGALASLLAYDAARFLFPRAWHALTWKYEHIYKMVATMFGLLSAASGNLLAFAQPWSQILPSVLGLMTILALWWRQHAAAGRLTSP